MNIKTVASYVVRPAAFTLGLVLLASAASGVARADAPIPAAAPEVDPGSLASAMTLLVGGALTLAGRVRRTR